MSDSSQPHQLQHTRLPCPSLTLGACSNSCPLSQWCHPTISPSLAHFFFPQSFPASGSFPVSQFFASSGQSIGVSASVSVLPMNIQDWFPLGWTGWISLLSKWLFSLFLPFMTLTVLKTTGYVFLQYVLPFGFVWCFVYSWIEVVHFWQEPHRGGHAVSIHHIRGTQGLNLSFLHCWQILYHLSHQGSPIRGTRTLYSYYLWRHPWTLG